jgi:hypothetical protein
MAGEFVIHFFRRAALHGDGLVTTFMVSQPLPYLPQRVGRIASVQVFGIGAVDRVTPAAKSL